jgi:hypothetical protein
MEILQALHESGFAGALRRADTFYPFLNAAHILSIALLAGTIATLDMRALGAFRSVPFAALATPLPRMAVAGLAGAVVTGLLMFTVQPVAYAANNAFLMKIVLVGIGILNAYTLHSSGAWRRAVAGGAIEAPVKSHAVLSLLIWVTAVMAGRWIGFLD